MKLGTILRQTYPFIKPYIRMSIISLCFGQISSLLNLSFPLLIKILIDDVIPSGNLTKLTTFGLTLTGVVAGSVIFDFASAAIYATFSERCVINARDTLFTKIIRYNMAFHEKTPIGEIMTRLREDSTYLHVLVSYFVSRVVTNGLKIIVSLGILWTMNYQLTIGIILTVPLYLWINKFFGEKVERQIGIFRSYLSKLVTFFHDILTKIQVVKNHNYEDKVHEIHQNISEDLKKHSVKTEMLGYFAGSLTSMATSLSSVAVLWIGGYIIIRGNVLTIGELVAFYGYLNHIFGPTKELASSNIIYNQAKNSVKRFFEYIELGDSYNEYPENDSSTVSQSTKIKGDIEFKDVKFNYAEDSPIFAGLNFHVHPSEKVVIYGASGIGKSSLAKLMKRFYGVKEGKILIDGISIKEYPLKSLRDQIGYIPQDSKLLCDTVAQNLLVGKQTATHEEMWEVLDMVNLGGFIRSLPDQLDTFLPNDGSTVSGGQKQRLAIARLLLQDSQVVIFDEFLSNIDPVSQNIILNNLEQWFTGKTVIFISHEHLDAKYITNQYIFDQNRTLRPFTEEEVLAYWQVASN